MFSARYTFTALTSDGRVVIWGHLNFDKIGENSSNEKVDVIYNVRSMSINGPTVTATHMDGDTIEWDNVSHVNNNEIHKKYLTRAGTGTGTAGTAGTAGGGAVDPSQDETSPVQGCMDSGATNYDTDATFDGSCTYAPVDCEMGSWSDPSICIANTGSCGAGAGIKTQTRTITREASNGGDCAWASMTQTQSCDLEACPFEPPLLGTTGTAGANEVDNMVNIISRLQKSGESLTGNLTYSAALIGSDSVEYCLSNEELGKKCARIGPGIIELDDLGVQINLTERDTENYQLNSPKLSLTIEDREGNKNENKNNFELNFPKFGLQLSQQQEEL